MALGYGTSKSIQFMIAMIVGMMIARALAERQQGLATPAYE